MEKQKNEKVRNLEEDLESLNQDLQTMMDEKVSFLLNNSCFVNEAGYLPDIHNIQLLILSFSN